MAVTEIYELMEGLPPGAWVAISTEQHLVLAYGDDAEVVVEKARQMGVDVPFLGRVPDHETLMFF